MIILRKIWSIIKSVFSALTKEPENSQLDVGIPATEDDVSTDESVTTSDTGQDTNQSN